jgi:tryptophanyl-tRNA synthetase
MSAPASSRKLPQGKRILSGIQSTGTAHLGNYFGMMRQCVALQNGNDARYFIADYHSMTTVHDPAARRRFTHDIVLDFMALGLDPERAIMYRQSDVPEVCELTWMLATVTGLGILERAHAYKDGISKAGAVETGLFLYPVLMAADILIHRADFVPVGQDQQQHIEMTRDMAGRFNQRYGEILHLPEGYILEEVATLPGLDGRKMSKSYGNTIEMFAPEKELRKRIMQMVTDSTPVEQPKNPDLPIFQLWNLFASADERAAMRERCVRGGLGYGEVKKDLADRILSYFADARRAREDWAKRPSDVEDVLASGARRVREDSAPLLEAVRQACGVGRP